MSVFLGVVLGAILGGVLLHGGGIVVGALLGWMAVTLLDVSSRLRRLESGIHERPAPVAPREEQPQQQGPSRPVAAPAGPPPGASWPARTPVAERVPSSVPAESQLVTRLKELLFGGNTAVRAGVVVLFFGVAFLLKYAVEHSLLPIELRLAGAALGGLVLLALGWRLRERRPGYALTLQGGGIGVLYLAVFAALRLYLLIPAPAAFALLVAIVAASTALALLQGSLALAALGVTGGFLAPVLTSTGSGNHVFLFGYYALLNAGILVISGFRAWRVLNLIGFAFTFVIGALWGYRFYRPELFATTEPFLVLFFLLYVAIAVLFAFRQPPDLKGYVDGTLVFGVPMVGALLQAALVRDLEYGLAWSALALGFFYLTLAGALFRRAPPALRTLVEAFLALGTVFATLAIPLALDGRWTAAAWAVEGAGIAWVGVRQQRLAPRLFGALLVFAAGVSFLGDSSDASGPPVLNVRYLGSLMVSVAALMTAYFFNRVRAALRARERPLALALLVWGLLWWYGAGLSEIGKHVVAGYGSGVDLVFVALSCAAVEAAGTRLRWAALRASSVVLLPALALLLAHQHLSFAHPFSHGGYLAWPVAIAALYWVLYRREGDAHATLLRGQHAAAFWLLTVLAALELSWALGEAVSGGRDWQRLAWALASAAMLALGSAAARWPFGPHRETYLTLGSLPVAAGALLWVVYACIESSGEPAPLDYLPLLNPLDLATAFLWLALARWVLALRALRPQAVGRAWPALYGALGVVAFAWVNAMLFRGLHHFAGIDYSLGAMANSVLAQAAMSLCWSALALVLVTIATRMNNRILWLSGAALLGIVVAKLFLVDLAGTGTMARIVSFLGVGALLLVIGYLSPVPPRAGRQGETA